MTDRIPEGFTDEGAKMLYLSVFYDGPWDRLAGLLWGVNSGRLVSDGSLRDRLATFCDSRDTAWRRRYVRIGQLPPDRWLRKPGR